MSVHKLLFGVALTLSLTVQGQFPMTPELKEAHGQIYSLRFNEAVIAIRSFEASHEEQQTTAYLRFCLLFLKHFVDEDGEVYEQDRRRMEGYLDQVEEGPDDDPHYYLYLGEMNLQMAALEAKFGHTWGAGQYALSGLSALEDGQEEFPDFKPMLAGMGVLNVAIGSLPSNYRFAASILGYSGEVERGIRYIRQAMDVSRNDEEYAYLHDKHVFLYAYILQQLEPDEISSLRSLGADPAQNPLLAFLESKMLQSEGKVDEVIDLLERVKRLPGRYEFPYLDYQLGRAKLCRGDIDANVPLMNYLRRNKGENYNKSTQRYLSWYYRLRGDMTRSNLYRDMAAQPGKTFVGADLEAFRECSTPLLSIDLLKARLAFDAGNHAQALSFLDAGSSEICSRDEEYLEYYYRKGRIYQAMGKSVQALAEFRQTLRYNPDPTAFARVNSELQMAMLYESKDPEAARRHYSNVLKFEDYPWYEGCQQTAKAGLERLEQ